ncbi:MAG: serine/threonine-protein phosphatase, partial [Ilumatobacter sp.]|nr:serine/threonine-protein phosphatase [Ilumatobacter sp.]
RALAGIAAEASVALGRAQMFDVEHTIAVTLQRSLLSEQVPSVEGWRIDPWYSPSNELLMVGGDLYDVVALPDGRFVIVVGDVVGHGLDAASSLGQLRSASRALALDRTRPAEMLDRLDRFAASTPGIRGATLCCAIIEPSGWGRYACAGHPYPVLVDADGATLLTEGRFPLLGYGGGARRDDAELMVEPGASLVLYTDGVVERPDESIDDGFERLRRVVRTIDFRNGEHPARAVGDAMMPGERRDDAVVVCVTRTG